MSASSQSLRFILSLRINSSFITLSPDQWSNLIWQLLSSANRLTHIYSHSPVEDPEILPLRDHFGVNGTVRLYYEREGGIIRIYHEYEGGIEKSIPRITDWHHEACQVMTIGDREGRIFFIPFSHESWILFLARRLIPHSYQDFQKILNTLRCDMVTSF